MQRAAAVGGLRGDRAAVRLGDLAHDRQAEAGAGLPARRSRAVEAVEDVRRGRRRRCPGPWSRTVSSPSRSAHVHDGSRPGSTWRRCRAGCATARSSAPGHAADERRLELGREARRRGACRRARSTAPATSASRRTSSMLGSAPRRGRARRGRRRARSAPRAGATRSASSRSRSPGVERRRRARAPRGWCAAR